MKNNACILSPGMVSLFFHGELVRVGEVLRLIQSGLPSLLGIRSVEKAHLALHVPALVLSLIHIFVYLVITGFIGAFKAYSDAVALFGTDLNAAGMNTIVGYVYDMLYGDSGGYPSYASAAAIILFVIVLTITCVNLLVTRKQARD